MVSQVDEPPKGRWVVRVSAFTLACMPMVRTLELRVWYIKLLLMVSNEMQHASSMRVIHSRLPKNSAQNGKETAELMALPRRLLNVVHMRSDPRVLVVHASVLESGCLESCRAHRDESSGDENDYHRHHNDEGLETLHATSLQIFNKPRAPQQTSTCTDQYAESETSIARDAALCSCTCVVGHHYAACTYSRRRCACTHVSSLQRTSDPAHARIKQTAGLIRTKIKMKNPNIIPITIPTIPPIAMAAGSAVLPTAAVCAYVCVREYVYKLA
jgi:hypothetical protein